MNTMTLVFFLLSAALLLLAVLLLWFVPHLLSQQEQRASREALRLRQLLADVLGEQEAVALRQSQLGTSLSYLQDQLEQLHTSWPATVEELVTQPAATSRPLLEQMDQRLISLQGQLEGWMHDRKGRLQSVSTQENESWAYLMSLLGSMQDQLGAVEGRGPRHPAGSRQAEGASADSSRVITDLRDELASLQTISAEVAALQWRLRRTLTTRSLNGSDPAHLRENGGLEAHMSAQPVRAVKSS
ncbi:MAG TPA: hypothetical protein VGE07_23005 [Herpetosiphonaceae bacterium]